MGLIRDLKFAAIARRHGLQNPLRAIQEAHDTEHVGPALALAVLEQESGGRNVWGHDRTIFIGGWDARHARYWTRKAKWRGYVNKAGYLEYRRQRRASQNTKMQGVGPMQLTWWATQDAADQAGGCWNPRVNIRVGLRLLDSSIDRRGYEAGIKAYNGSGPAAERYAQQVLAKRAVWRKRLGID